MNSDFLVDAQSNIYYKHCYKVAGFVDNHHLHERARFIFYIHNYYHVVFAKDINNSAEFFQN